MTFLNSIFDRMQLACLFYWLYWKLKRLNKMLKLCARFACCVCHMTRFKNAALNFLWYLSFLRKKFIRTSFLFLITTTLLTSKTKQKIGTNVIFKVFFQLCVFWRLKCWMQNFVVNFLVGVHSPVIWRNRAKSG